MTRKKFLGPENHTLYKKWVVIITIICFSIHNITVDSHVVVVKNSTSANNHHHQSKDPRVEKFEPVFYEPSDLLTRHKRIKRETGNKDFIKLHLKSPKKEFALNLTPDKSIFHPDPIIENSVGPISYDTKKIVVGHVEDKPESIAQGVISQTGYFDGHISLQDGKEIYIEPTHRYSNSPTSPGLLYHSSNIIWPQKTPTCASHLLHKQNSMPIHQNNSIPAANLNSPRHKRWAINPNKKTCLLFLQADHLFYSHFGSEEAAIDMMVRHIQRVNEIYKATDFDSDGVPDGISFMIKRIKVHTSNNDTTSEKYRYDGEFQVIKFLELFSEGDYDSYCLAYMFTFRDFEGGTLGLAWTGDLKNAGGVCERKGHFRGGLKSLNTGIITLLNYGKVVLPAVSYVTLAHEIGHNFGSPHDPEDDKNCTPGGADGNYIMYARATAGDQKNNNKFSPCSLRNIAPVLNYKAREAGGCFSEEETAICGNREVEEGEECDCGWEEDCKESCCHPMTKEVVPGRKPCTLKRGKACSPSQGPCCNTDCSLIEGDKCREDNGCRGAAFCDGFMPVCPPSVHKANKTVCQNGVSVCFRGECTGSICLAYGLESCQCTPKPWESASKMCELCCKLPGEGQECKSSFHWNESPYDVPNLYSKPGSPCRNYTGYCDSYHNCREVDPSGPLATLRKLLLADEGLTAIADWVDNHWYAVMSFVALFIVMMILTAKLCGKRAKAQLRKITVMHSNVEAIQVQRTYYDEQGEHVVHPTAVRKKIPLRKKIRERHRSKNRVKSSSKGNNKSSSKRTNTSTNNNNNNQAHKSSSIFRRKKSSKSAATPFSEAGVGSSHKTEKSSSPNNCSKIEEEETINLVQLQTPSDINGVLPTPSTSGGSSGVQKGANNGAKSGGGDKSPGVNNNKPPTPPLLPPMLLVNHHEPKTAILPSASALSTNKGRKKRRDPNKKSPGGGKKSVKTLDRTHKTRSSGSNNRRKIKSPQESAISSPNKSINIEFKSPFSFKVVTNNNATSSKNVKTRKVENAGKNKNDHVKPKVKSSGSFLQRRMKKSSKGELRVLIPQNNKNNNDDEEINSPMTS